MVQARHQAFERSTITHGRWQYSFKMRDTVLCETKQHRSTLPEKHVGEVDACHFATGRHTVIYGVTTDIDNRQRNCRIVHFTVNVITAMNNKVLTDDPFLLGW